MTNQATQGVRVNRAEWAAIAALGLSAGSIIFSGGVLWSKVQANSAMIAMLQSRSDATAIQLTRIDANVTFLAERAREDRESRRAIWMADQERLEAEAARSRR